MSEHLLEVESLEVQFITRAGTAHAVRDVSFTVDRGETLGLVGESGSGKSVTAFSILGLIQLPGRITGGDVRWKGESLLGEAGQRRLQTLRGRELAIVFQDPMTSLNPLFTVEKQIGEVLRLHRGLSRGRARECVVELLDLVGIPSPKAKAKAYPHELSGGQRQRVMIAMALAGEPELLIADEPTTALDVTIQAQILDLIAELQARLGLAVLLITHDLGVVAEVCKRVAVMYGGKIMESGAAADLFERPGHPYTKGLLGSTPRLDVVLPRLVGIDGVPPDLLVPPPGCPFEQRCPIKIDRCANEMPPLQRHEHGREVACWRAFADERFEPTPQLERLLAEPLVRVEELTVRFPAGRAGFWGQEKLYLHAVGGVSFVIGRGETLGLVGESGCGKTTTGRAILRRVPLDGGRITFDGEDITHVEGESLRRLRRGMQLVFQDPYASLNPRMRVLEIVAEPLLVHGVVRRVRDAEDRVAELLELVGLPPGHMFRYPHAFSGGQRQRINIARALSLEPDFIVADEPVSALDVSIRAQVVNLMQDIQERLGLTYLFIGHDLSVVRHISHRIAVMYAGKIVEIGDRDEIYEDPKHPYTKALLSAVPIPDPKLEATRQRTVLQGPFPNLIDPPVGCRFESRCPVAIERCVVDEPPLEDKASGGHRAACWLA